ncbi:hypothetical protein [Bifidobacterium pseudolongum]|uniref:hypothetical protein n=1 Tax=Bifidobacterium pseudolongum TaxID=1694 RepID=UPI001F1106FD|nr:hypothetical protein [Bifidobacterium pseudolongum]MCH4856206.1 hypothetical protein [Bifidobacterium pseudolongum]
MEITDLLSIVIAFIGAVCAVIALFQSHSAHKAAKNANTLSEAANELAAESVKIAHGANDLAKDANKISEDANTISKRALGTSRDQTVYRWKVQWDTERRQIAITNDSASPALDVSAIIRSEDQTIVNTRRQRLEPFEQMTFNAPLIREQLLEQLDGTAIIIPFVNLRASIIWNSELGKHFSLEGQQLLSDGDDPLVLNTSANS